MKRIVLYCLILAAALLAPVKGNDVGRLCPVQVVLLGTDGQNVYLQTDTQDVGVGEDALRALENLKATTAGIIYLDTARYLLVEEQALDQVEPLRKELKKTVKLCLAEGAVLGEDTASFLKTHGCLPSLKAWEKGMELPLLTTFEKRLIFSKKS